MVTGLALTKIKLPLSPALIVRICPEWVESLPRSRIRERDLSILRAIDAWIGGKITFDDLGLTVRAY